MVKKAGEKVSAFYEEERDIMARAASPWLTKLDYAFQVRRGQARSALFRTAMRAPALQMHLEFPESSVSDPYSIDPDPVQSRSRVLMTKNL